MVKSDVHIQNHIYPEPFTEIMKSLTKQPWMETNGYLTEVQITKAIELSSIEIDTGTNV